MRLDYLLLFCTFVFEISCYNFEEREKFFRPPQNNFRSKRYLNENKSDPQSNAKDLNPKWNSTWIDKLKKVLLLNYDKYARPIHHGNTTSVTLDPTIYHVDLDEQRSIMTLHGYLKLTWHDDKLKWSPSEFGGLNIMRLADHELWQPDIFPYNSASGSAVDHYGNVNSLIYEDGTVVWVPPSILHVFCHLDLRKWPFDTQVCPLKLGPWTYNGEQVDFNLAKHNPEFENLVPNSEWKFVKIDKKKNVVYYKCCPNEPYTDLQYNLTLERRSPTYKALVITPATSMVLMTLSTFWLPPTSGRKLMLGGVTIFIICLFLLYFVQKVSAMGGNTPLIVLFYSSSLYLVSFSVVLSVIIINISRNPKTFPLPWIIKCYLKGWLGKCLFIENFIPAQGSSSHHSFSKLSRDEGMTNSRSAFSDSPEGQGIESASLRSCQHDWVLLAIALDRIAFLVYSFLFIVFSIAYLV